MSAHALTSSHWSKLFPKSCPGPNGCMHETVRGARACAHSYTGRRGPEKKWMRIIIAILASNLSDHFKTVVSIAYVTVISEMG